MGYDYRLMDQLERKALLANVHYKCAFVAAIRETQKFILDPSSDVQFAGLLVSEAVGLLAEPWIDKAPHERWTAYARMIRVDSNDVVSGEIGVR